MTVKTRISRVKPSWYYLLLGVAAPLGGGLIKLGQASTWAGAAVGLARCVLLATLCAVFFIGYFPAAACSLYFAKNRQDAADRLVMTSAWVIVSLLALIPATKGRKRTGRPTTPGGESSEQSA